jgi:hypothetical protein
LLIVLEVAIGPVSVSLVVAKIAQPVEQARFLFSGAVKKVERGPLALSRSLARSY